MSFGDAITPRRDCPTGEKETSTCVGLSKRSWRGLDARDIATEAFPKCFTVCVVNMGKSQHRRKSQHGARTKPPPYHLLIMVSLVHQKDAGVVSGVANGPADRLIDCSHADVVVVFSPSSPAAAPVVCVQATTEGARIFYCCFFRALAMRIVKVAGDSRFQLVRRFVAGVRDTHASVLEVAWRHRQVGS